MGRDSALILVAILVTAALIAAPLYFAARLSRRHGRPPKTPPQRIRRPLYGPEYRRQVVTRAPSPPVAAREGFADYVSQETTRRRQTEDERYRALLGMVGGVSATAAGLVEYELRLKPSLTRLQAIDEAIDRLVRDRNR